MKKRILSLLLVLFLFAMLPMAVGAAAQDGDLLVLDEAELLSENEYLALQENLTELSARYNAQIVVATLSALEDGDFDEFMDFLYDEAGFGYGEQHDGVLLLVCMDPRNFGMVANGYAGDAISPDTVDAILDAMASDMSAGNYAAAFDTFAAKCEYYLDGHINGFPFKTGQNLLIALAIGILAGLIVTGSFKSQLKSVQKAKQANAYVKAGSMQVTYSNDFYLYRTVTQREKEKKDSSSSGGSRSSGSRSF